MRVEVLGVDIGGVIIDRINDNTDTSFFSTNYLRTSAVPQALEVIRELAQKRFGTQVYLVSKCGRTTQAKTLEWLSHNKFYEATKVASSSVRFCRERHQKAGICEELGITHFVDDRLEVLGYLASVEKKFLFQPHEKEVRRFAHHLKHVQRVDSWEEIKEELLG